MKWAPNSTKSILQEYPNQIAFNILLNHSGLALAFDSVLHLHENASTVKSQGNTNDIARFVSALCLRSRYAGEIAGLLSVPANKDNSSVADRLIKDIWTSCEQKSDAHYRGSLWRATAYLILCTNTNRQLLHAIASSQVNFFTTSTMETAIECWQWILTARVDLEISLLQELVMAWQATFDKQIGLFTRETQMISPLAAYEGCQMQPNNIDITPHIIWLNLISEMVDTAKYCNRDKVEMFCMLLHRCLPLDKRITRCRNISTVGCRFKLLQCGLSLLQGNVISKSLSRNILRERIYYYALDYFCSYQMCPPQNRTQLLEDIQIMMKFWQTMRSEKRHLVAAEVSEAEINTNQLTVTKSSYDTISISGNDLTRSGSTLTGGWYNTIPHSTSTLSKKSTGRSKRSAFTKDMYDKDYMKKRNLILELLAAELEFLIIWYNPLGTPDLRITGEDAIMEWRTRPVKMSLWKDYTRLAWSYNPALAIFMPQR